MRWISVIEWRSDTEAVVEDGVWCCPLGGGADVSVWEFRDGSWQFKESKGGWFS
jgi:hypothetical protein